MTQKNEKMNERFFALPLEKQMSSLGLNENVSNQSRFKNMLMEEIVKQIWNGRYNSEKRCILKNVVN